MRVLRFYTVSVTDTELLADERMTAEVPETDPNFAEMVKRYADVGNAYEYARIEEV